MDKLELVKQYENSELCAKFSNNIPLSELQDGKYMLLTDSQDIYYISQQFIGTAQRRAALFSALIARS